MMNKKKSFWALIRNRIFTGFLVVAPIGLSLGIAFFVYKRLTSWSISIIRDIPVFSSFADKIWFTSLVRIFSVLLILLLLFVVGELVKYTIGKRFVSFAEWVVMKTPVLKTVYSLSKELGQAISKKEAYRKVVLFEYPRKGIYVIGYLTNENFNKDEIQDKTNKNLVSIFLPTTPNPTSGFLLFIPREDCIFLDMDVAEGTRVIISGGGVSPSAAAKEIKS